MHCVDSHNACSLLITLSADRSTPSTDPLGPTSLLMKNVSLPHPHPRSTTFSPSQHSGWFKAMPIALKINLWRLIISMN